MAAITHEATTAADHGDVHDDHEDHPTDLLFWKVGGFLAVVTAVEVSTIWWRSWGAPAKITALALIAMMVVKFSVVGLYFMHLKWDAKILRRVFTVGVVLALTRLTAGRRSPFSAEPSWRDWRAGVSPS